MRQQLAGLVDVASGFEFHGLDVEAGQRRGQAPRDLSGLRQRHRALARADPQSIHH